jgi:hypothetical protein
VIVAIASVALLVLMLVVHWNASRTGWQALSHLRWLILVTVVSGLALAWFQATRRAPAVPVTFAVIVTTLALPTVAWLVYRVVASPPAHQRVGAALGLLSELALLVGGFVSMRQEGIDPADEPAHIPTVTTGRP